MVRGERGPRGDHGQKGDKGNTGASPKYRFRGWGPVLGIALVVIVVMLGFLFTDVRTDEAIRVAREEAVKEGKARDAADRRAQAEANNNICRIAATNRTQSIVLLQAFRTAITEEADPDDAENLAIIDGLLAQATTPFPEPCTRFTPAPS